MSETPTDSIDEWTNDVHQGDAVETLAAMPESSVHMAMCSPPYFQLRDYGADGQIGLEDSLDEYIANLVDVADELRRVLRPDGSLWLNLGDTFGGSDAEIGRKQKMLVPHRVAIALQEAGWVLRDDVVWSKPNPMPDPVEDRPRVDKEFVFFLTPDTDYWWDLDSIREPHAERSLERTQEGPVNPDVDGRGTNDYMEPDDLCHPNGKNPGDVWEITTKPYPDAHFAVYPPELCERPIKSSCPEAVCAECGTPYRRDVEETPLWERDVEDVDREQARKALERYHSSALTLAHLQAVRSVGFGDGDHGDAAQGSMNRVPDETVRRAREAKDVLGGYFREFVGQADREDAGLRQDCDCDTDETAPGVVLDPFAGAGTTCLVAKRLGRRFVGIDLNPDYVAMAQKRVGIDVDEPGRLLDDGETSLAAYADGGAP